MGLMSDQLVHQLANFPYDLHAQDGNLTYIFYTNIEVTEDHEGNTLEKPQTVRKDFWGAELDIERANELLYRGTNPYNYVCRMFIREAIELEVPYVLYNPINNTMEYNLDYEPTPQPVLREEFQLTSPGPVTENQTEVIESNEEDKQHSDTL